MLRRDFVRTVISVCLAPKLLLSQQRATDAPPPPAPVPWTLGLNPKNHCRSPEWLTRSRRPRFASLPKRRWKRSYVSVMYFYHRLETSHEPCRTGRPSSSIFSSAVRQRPGSGSIPVAWTGWRASPSVNISCRSHSLAMSRPTHSLSPGCAPGARSSVSQVPFSSKMSKKLSTSDLPRSTPGS
jgi:hypothetical protein